MAITLPELPFARNAIAPYISENTIDFHYGKHHKTYVDTLNKMVANSKHAQSGLETIIRDTVGDAAQAVVFNNAAQVWNHTFYWNSMKPGGGGQPTGAVATAIDRDFGSHAAFAEQFKAAGASQFGSGWVWLVVRNGTLAIDKTPNAQTPLTESGVTPLLTMDVWEHAYYLDYQNSRPNYMTSFVDRLVNWDFANRNLAAA